MQKLLNAMRLQAELASEGRNVTVRLGLLSNYVPQDHTATVKLMPENIMTGYLPIASQSVGNGWGIFSAPNANDVVVVAFQEGSIDSGIIIARLFTDSARPLSVPSGEVWMVHQSGSLLKFHNDGTVELTSSGTLTVKATSILLQNAGSLLKKLVNETFLAWFDGHTHTCAAPGSQSAIPTQQTSTSGSPLKTATTQAE